MGKASRSIISLRVVLPLCDSFCDKCGLSPKTRFKNITKNPAPKPLSWKPEHGINSSKTQQYLKNSDIKKQPPTARSLSAVHGAPNRIRTCGLLIRSQTLYPAELWVRAHLERKSLYQKRNGLSILFLYYFLSFCVCKKDGCHLYFLWKKALPNMWKSDTLFAI